MLVPLLLRALLSVQLYKRDSSLNVHGPRSVCAPSFHVKCHPPGLLGTGQKVCGGGGWYKPIAVLSLDQAEQYIEFFAIGYNFTQLNLHSYAQIMRSFETKASKWKS